MPDDRHLAVSGTECDAAANVVGVAVGVHDVRYRVGSPPLDRLNHLGAREGMRGVKRNQTVPAVNDHRMAETLNDGKAIADLGQLIGHPIHRFVSHTRIDNPRRQSQEITHAPTVLREPGAATKPADRAAPDTQKQSLLR